MQSRGSALLGSFTPDKTLLLIENSQSMKSVWPEIRNYHLPALIGQLEVTNPLVPVRQ